jgi:hypothetical protein
MYSLSCKACSLNDACPGFLDCPWYNASCFFCKKCGRTFVFDAEYNYHTVSSRKAVALRLRGHVFTEVTSSNGDCTKLRGEVDMLRGHCPK